MATSSEVLEYLAKLVEDGVIDEADKQAIAESGIQTVEEANIAVRELVDVPSYGLAPSQMPHLNERRSGSNWKPEAEETDAAEAVAERDRIKAEIAAAGGDLDELSAEDQEFIEQDSELAQVAEALMLDKNEYDPQLRRLEWAFSGDTVGLFGTPNEQMLEDLAWIAEEQLGVNPDLFVFQDRSGLMSMEDRIRIGMQKFFEQTNDTTIAAFTIWGQNNDRWMPQEDRDAYVAMRTLDVSWGQGKALLTAAATHGIEADTAITVFENARERGIVADPIDRDRKVFAGTDIDYRPPSAEDAEWAERMRPWMERHGYPTDTKPAAPPNEDYIAYQNAMAGKMTPTQMWDKYNSALDEYGSPLLANLALYNSELAQRLYSDPYSLSIEELKEVDELVGGVTNYENQPGTAGQAAWLQERMMGMKDVVKVDTAGAKEAARTLAAAWNMPELTDAALNQIANGQVAASLAEIRARQGNPFNPTVGGGTAVINAPNPYAATAEAMRGSAIYEELFKHRRSGESEEEYAQRFDRSVAKFTGDSDPVLARVGMRTGDTETVGRNLMATGEGYENSTFMERLAKMGNAFKEAT